MSVVVLTCQNCGAEPRLDAGLVTLVVDLTEDRATVAYRCPLCGDDGETADLTVSTQAILLNAGVNLAARER